jgi:penicillin amidase/acyl-homoserine-lactone acylase
VRILRDAWGIPHVFGRSDADTAFGLAWAHAEDDFETVQIALVAARGRLGELKGPEGARNDFFVRAFRVAETTEAGYERDLSPEFRRVLEGYAAGLSFYAERHRDELLLPDLLPFTGRDVVAGFVHKLPLFLGVAQAIERVDALGAGPERSGTARLLPASFGDASLLGSNAFAVGPHRSADGRTRLAINSHQPYEGPVAWYEVQLVSEEGWNASGGLFPGAPVVLHGHNERLGWAHTVNRADFVDVYRLETDPAHPERYRFDGAWRELESAEARLRVRLLGFLPWTVTRKLRWSVHGPVLELGRGEARGLYAFRVVGAGEARHAEQWWRMNRARSFAEWREAMRMQALPMFNTVYADAEGNVFYVYNALLPRRAPGFDASGVLPGDTSAALWGEALPFDALPQVHSPAAGFVQNANSSPFGATSEGGAPDPARYDPSLGVETRETDRSLRLRALLEAARDVDDAAFDAIKWDRRLPAGGWGDDVLSRLVAEPAPPDLAEARALLARWDGEMEASSREAALALHVLSPLFESRLAGRAAPDPWTLLRRGAAHLEDTFGRLDPTLGEAQRLRRGDRLDLPLGGGPDVVNATHARLAGDGRLVGEGGDCFVLLVSFGPEGARSRAVSVFGASARPGSKHFADQAPLFVRRETRPVWRTREEIRAHLEAEYHPGERP